MCIINRLLFFGLLLLVGLPLQGFGQVEPAPPDTSDELCEVETDEFTEKTSVVCPTHEFTVEEQPDETIYYTRARLQRQEGTNYLLIVTGSDSWNFLSAEEAYAIIDGENYQFKFATVDNETNDGGSVTEQNAALIPSKVLSQIKECSEFRMKVGRAVFDLSDSGLQKQASFILSRR